MSRQLGVLFVGALLCSQMANAFCSLDGAAENGLPKQEKVAMSAPAAVDVQAGTQDVANGAAAVSSAEIGEQAKVN